ncbi:subtype B tannase [Rhodococcus erythropolis]|uniref:subtype B tannase n=1 Tax=Rhodococcus erythropolis TaxID=1833 RepID=UPI00222609A3|nr:subtype B tannase [Rhodococcus erythropolis]MCW2295502.1 acetyl esterase/lipase [Rhodococcus erythropolis]
MSESAGTSTSAVAELPTALMFDAEKYTEQTITITTDGGDKEVAYRFYGPLTYVANPVDTDHQSLVISVPVSIDGVAVDARNAPIVFSNAVGGYMPATVKDATGVGEASMEMGDIGGGLPPLGGATGGGMPPMGGAAGMAPMGMTPTDGSATGEVQSGGNAMLDARGGMVSLPKLALAAGYVSVEPGCRGRSLTDAAGIYYGTAPAAIVDLKAAIRYVKANSSTIPGNTDRIVSTGTSAGGALSALLGASGDSALYEPFLTELGSADASDSVFATGAWCPITDLEHADAAYEWNWGTNVTGTGELVDQTVSSELRSLFVEDQNTLGLQGLENFGPITAENYTDYLLQTYLQPSSTEYLLALSDSERTAYLAANPFISWANDKATFTWPDYLSHVGARKKTEPAFDAFDLSAGENNLFGGGTTMARHFTQYSAQRDAAGLPGKAVEPGVEDNLVLMNPMYFVAKKNESRSRDWWIRLGTKDTDTALTISANLAAALDGLGDNVNHRMYWDEGHGSNTDAGDFIAWVGTVAGR